MTIPAPRPTPITQQAVGTEARPRRVLSPKALGPLLPRLRPHTGALSVAALCLVLSACVGLAFPRIVQYLLDAAFISGNSVALDQIALGLLALFAIQAVLNFAQVYILSATGERVVARLRSDLFAHLVHLSPGFFSERRTGELISRLSADIGLLQSVMSHQVSEFARQFLFLVGGVVMLSVTHTRLTVTTLAVVPVVVGAAWLFGRALRRASTGVQDRAAEATASAEEAFSQIRTVQSFTREELEIERYERHIGDVVLAAIRRSRIRGIFFGVITFSAFGGVVAVLWQGGRLVLEGALTPGALVSFLLYAITVAAAVGAIASLFGSYQDAIGAARRVFELLETDSSVAEPLSPKSLPRRARTTRAPATAAAAHGATEGGGDVRFEGVSFTYGSALPEVLHGVSLRIAPGEVVALVGPSGAGKTTIASLLTRFWDVSAGRITLDGADVRDLALADLRGAIGIVPQEPALFSGTVRENIAYARPSASEAEIAAAARASHSMEFIERLPQGFETRVGERGIKLSGGQRQRLAIARVFLKDPAVVILDEATSSLDSESERLVEEAMEDLLRGRSTLIIAHRLSTVRRADRVVVIDRGAIVEEGSHAELLAGDGVYARLYRGQYFEERAVGSGQWGVAAGSRE